MKTALVFGGETGIGAACVEQIVTMGATPFWPTWAQCDVRDPDQIAQAVADSQPDAVIFAAGINRLDWIHEISHTDFAEVMDTNVGGFLNVIQQLQETGRSYSVVAISSDAARRPMRTSAVYCASKAALDMCVRVASRELAGEGWRINAVSPGKVSGTAMTEYVDERVLELRGWTPEYAARYERQSSPLGRSLTPDEVAAVVCDVLFSESPGWTGDIITINGGR